MRVRSVLAVSQIMRFFFLNRVTLLTACAKHLCVYHISGRNGRCKIIYCSIGETIREREYHIHAVARNKVTTRSRVNYSQQISDSFPRPVHLRRSIGHADIPGRFIDEGVPCRIGEPLGRAEPIRAEPTRFTGERTKNTFLCADTIG